MSDFSSKGKSLLILKEAGFEVPSFVVLRESECAQANLQRVLREYFPGIRLFAVRSSSAGEDGKERSFAGAFYSALGVSKENVPEECEKVISSYKGRGGDVILQEFVPSAASGVIFSDAGGEIAVINANFGLCESVVKGRQCDEYIFDRQKEEILSEKVEPQKEAVYYRNGRFEKDARSGRVLDDQQIREIVEKALAIERLFKAPQDIEFCIFGGKLLILQSRPITRPVFANEAATFYDSANIAESYSGMVLPLTLSFVKMVYSVVYADLVRASGVSRSKIDKHKEIFETLTASFYGRLFYNMNRWYEMMSFFPGYERNKSNLELMISSNEKNEIARDIKPSNFFSIFYYVLVAIKFVTFPVAVFRFKRSVRAALAKYSRLTIETMTFDECEALFRKLVSELLTRWYVAVENDTVLMTLLGRANSKSKDVFDLMSITSHTVSADQVKRVKQLADVLMEDEAVASAIHKKDSATFVGCLSANKKAREQYEEYFSIYGGRFADELKLESNDLKDDFGKFSSLMEMYARTELIASTFQKKLAKGGPLAFLIRYFATNREEMRLLRSNMFSIVRALFLRIGTVLYEEGALSNPGDIFYLSIDEAFGSEKTDDGLKDVIDQRKKNYLKYSSMNVPSHFSLLRGELPKIEAEGIKGSAILHGSPSSPGFVSGTVRIFEDFHMPDSIDFDILVASHTDPGWVPLIGLAKGLIIEYGGILSHASIVSRELGIPAIVGVRGATKILKNGDYVELDARRGILSIKSRT